MTEPNPSSSTSVASTDASAHKEVAAPSTASANPYTRQIAPQRSKVKPRWHTQPYMMFLALRSLPNRTGARQEIISAAVELDKKFSAERGWPRVFTGKTPFNSASACLTNNGDKYFIPFKPEGSKSTHFRLAYQPGDFDTAVKEYDSWMEKLIKLDWPLCFGVPKEGAVPIHILEREEQAQKSLEEAGKDSEEASSGPSQAKLKEELPLEERQTTSSTADHLPNNDTRIDATTLSSESKKRSPDPIESEVSDRNSKKVRAEQDHPLDCKEGRASSASLPDQKQDQDSKVTEKLEQLDLEASQASTPTLQPSTPEAHTPSVDGKSTEVHTPSTSSTTVNATSGDSAKVDEYRLEDLDLSSVPTSLSDIVRVDVSTIPNSGNGLFAKIDLPASTPLGFYFGVPMTENEFDSIKDGVGVASHYSIMYRRTVLDATDEKGMPYSDPNGRLYCPFHFMNEDPNGNITFITGAVVNQVICTTNRDIKAGEELFVFYGKEVDRFWQEEGENASSGGDQPKKEKTKSRTSSPVRREQLGDRPRRSNVYMPARYGR
ncbi:hypothetical protein EMPS_03323 [Entomortierella parvispora]|uniref:SET domain-containing protein n=1 Tax=Entomortierella parvispora TaxID=205924 RepID=A0A9P3LUE9_9FUNG|nr:hypothetical protein EMPS_03323 [Entomortierella parvispora]